MAQPGPVLRGRTPAIGKYAVAEELGHGGMATVYRAHDSRLARDVALKVLHPHLRDSKEIAHRFSVEARAVAKLRHPNIVEVYDVSGEDDEEQYLVVELVRGLPLRRVLQDHGELPPEIAASIGVLVLDALAHAHAQGIVHRDVKPENVLLEHTSLAPRGDDSSNGDGAAVKLTDFGIAKMMDAQGVTSTGQVLGSPAHMAPEQIEGGEVDARADVFGAGVMLYECMVGHLPFEGNNPAQVLRRVLEGLYPPAENEQPKVGKTWSSILDRALAHDPEARFASAEAMKDAILAELALVGIDDPKVTIATFFDDRDRWTREFDEELVKLLTERGNKARKAGDTLTAAAAFNRALAYAPTDAILLKTVATLHKREARKRLAKRIVPLAFTALVLVPMSFAGARYFRQHSGAEPSASSSGSGAPRTSAPSVSLSATPEPSATVVRARPPPTVIPIPKVERKVRAVVLGGVRPGAGVKVALDGDPVGDASVGLRITVDEKPHELTFTCVEDLCEPQRRSVTAGEQDETVSVVLKIRDALLVVDGDPQFDYGIPKFSDITVKPGVPVRIPMQRGSDVVSVVQRANPPVTVTVSLMAGKEARANFKKVP